MMAKLGILAFGSLIDNPGWEIEEAITARKSGIRTPFGVEFARKSRKTRSPNSSEGGASDKMAALFFSLPTAHVARLFVRQGSDFPAA
jgi:cation transport regulator ChaC